MKGQEWVMCSQEERKNKTFSKCKADSHDLLAAGLFLRLKSEAKKEN